VFRNSDLKKALGFVGLGVIAAVLGYHAWGHPMDFRVYHYGARGVFDGTRPVYGLSSGLGWPMHYRYPPLFLLLFAPLTALPIGPAAAMWGTAKIVVLVWLVRALWNSSLKRQRLDARYYVVPVLFITPYLIEEFRYGNAQFFVIALTIASLVTLSERPALAAVSLALAISIKVWPAFFLPYFAVRREWKVVGLTIAAVAIFALLPSLYFGVVGNFELLGQWFAQESHTQLGESEVWFPSQSLRGVMMRYLTQIDYSQVPDSNYALVNVVSMNPSTVRLLWMVLAGGIYAAFLFLENRRRNNEPWFDHALAFCLIALLQPFTQKYALSVLLWPALAAAALMKSPSVRILLCLAATLALIQPLAPGAGVQRYLQVIGMDFWAALLLTVAAAAACLKFQNSVTPT
jgi:Glycosyltransferase family 87